MLAEEVFIGAVLGLTVRLLISALQVAGFVIEQLHEVTEEDKDNPRHRIPMFLDILATRGRRERKMLSGPPPNTDYWHG